MPKTHFKIIYDKSSIDKSRLTPYFSILLSLARLPIQALPTHANEPDTKGHLECRGLILGDRGTIHAIPEIKGTRAGVDLSHEAAVGKIAEEEVEYLMARSLTRDESTAAIIRGFLTVDIQGLPAMLNEEMQKAVKSSEKELF